MYTLHRFKAYTVDGAYKVSNSFYKVQSGSPILHFVIHFTVISGTWTPRNPRLSLQCLPLAEQIESTNLSRFEIHEHLLSVIRESGSNLISGIGCTFIA